MIRNDLMVNKRLNDNWIFFFLGWTIPLKWHGLMEDSSHALLCEFKKACYWNGRSISALRRHVLGHTLSGAGLWEVSLIKGQLLPASCPSRLRVNRPAWCNNLGKWPCCSLHPSLVVFSSLAHRGCLDQAAWPSSLGRALGGVPVPQVRPRCNLPLCPAGQSSP